MSNVRRQSRLSRLAAAFAVAVFQPGNFVGGGKEDYRIVLPRLFFGIDDEGAGEHFDFVAEEVQRNGAGEIGEIVEADAAVRKFDSFWAIEANFSLRVRDLFAGKLNADVLDSEGGLVDDEQGFVVCGKEIDRPRAFPGAQAGIARVK